MLLLALLLCASGVDPRVVEAQQLAVHGEEGAALAQLQAVLHDIEASGDSGSAALHRNIGTLALRTGNAGLAMRHLLSAQRRHPGDDDVAYNLRLVREARADRIDTASNSSLGQRLPPAAVRFAAGASLLVVGLLVLMRGWFGLRVPTGLLATAAVVVVACVSLWGARLDFEGQTVSVVMRDTRARESPDARSADAKSGFDVHPGLSGVLLRREGDFEQLRLENGVETWIRAADLLPVR